MKITAFSSTPRMRGNSDILTDRAVEAAEQAGATVEKLRLGDYSISPCTACEACRSSGDDRCIIDDDGNFLLSKIKKSDGIILASSIYFFTMSAQLKILIDRFYALGGDGYWSAFTGKRLGVILTYEDHDPLASGVVNAAGTFKDAARFLKMELAGIIHACCGPEADVLGNPEALEAAEELGRKLAG